MIVDVTQADINNGLRNNAFGDNISISYGKRLWRPWLKTSRRAGQFMGRFDAGKAVRPSRFRLGGDNGVITTLPDDNGHGHVFEPRAATEPWMTYQWLYCECGDRKRVHFPHTDESPKQTRKRRKAELQQARTASEHSREVRRAVTRSGPG